MNNQELVKRVVDVHQRVTNALAGLTDEQTTRVGFNGEWSVKDLLAHLTAWKKRGAAELVSIANGTWQPQKMEMTAVHAFNRETVSSSRTQSLSEVRANFRQSHVEMLDLIAALPEHEFDETAPAFRVVNGGSVRHFAHHAAQLEDWKLKITKEKK